MTNNLIRRLYLIFGFSAYIVAICCQKKVIPLIFWTNSVRFCATKSLLQHRTARPTSYSPSKILPATQYPLPLTPPKTAKPTHETFLGSPNNTSDHPSQYSPPLPIFPSQIPYHHPDSPILQPPKAPLPENTHSWYSKPPKPSSYNPFLYQTPNESHPSNLAPYDPPSASQTILHRPASRFPERSLRLRLASRR